jgi:RimJ/RimL family protein N-acetyltransferase
MTRFLFGDLRAERVEIRCDSRNMRSAALASRAGYVLEAVLKRESRANDDTLRDTMVFAMLKDEYQALVDSPPDGMDDARA